jgi:hypothetical protein
MFAVRQPPADDVTRKQHNVILCVPHGACETTRDGNEADASIMECGYSDVDGDNLDVYITNRFSDEAAAATRKQYQRPAIA